MTSPDGAPIRLSDAERDALAEALGRHYVEGRIDADALNARVDAVYAAELRDEARAAVADLPAPTGTLPPPAKPVGRRWLRRRHGEADVARPGWRPTPERFQDPTTQRIMRVWIDPVDGARHYVPEGA
jgi:hypothetical protein